MHVLRVARHAQIVVMCCTSGAARPVPFASSFTNNSLRSQQHAIAPDEELVSTFDGFLRKSKWITFSGTSSANPNPSG
jgi:hypothetical protein